MLLHMLFPLPRTLFLTLHYVCPLNLRSQLKYFFPSEALIYLNKNPQRPQYSPSFITQHNPILLICGFLSISL